MDATTIDYVGDELTLFESALNWKQYLRKSLAPHLSGDVAEVGAGLGATSKALGNVEGVRSWTCIEPDPGMTATLREMVDGDSFAYPIDLHAGTLSDLPETPAFDTIIYIDVLEHIDDDRAEVEQAVARLRPGGKLVVLCPAYQFLYSPFDKAIGHYRRHTKRSLRNVAGAGLVETAAFYMDSVGALASLANKMALRQSMPTLGQVKFWDSMLVPVSRVTDPLVLRMFGKSVVVVWTKG